MEVLERRREEREKIINKAKNYVQRIPGKTSAFLVGSYARGDFNLWSDVDIILVKKFTGNPIERLRMIDAPAGFEIIPLTAGEFVNILRKKNPFASDLLNFPVVLRDDFELLRE